MILCKKCGGELPAQSTLITNAYDGEDIGVIGPYCPTCLNRIKVCKFCHSHIISKYNSSNSVYICKKCKNKNKENGCFECGATLVTDHEKKYKVCATCIENNFALCSVLDKYDWKFNFVDKTSANFLQYSYGFKGFDMISKEGFESHIIKNHIKAKPVFSCYNCGTATINKKELIETERKGSKYYTCKKCIEKYHACEKCGLPGVLGALSKTGKYGLLCDDCIKQKRLIHCSSCHNFFKLAPNHNDVQPFMDLCPPCSKRVGICEGCGGFQKKSESISDEYHLCKFCNEGTAVCNECSKIILPRDRSDSVELCRACFIKKYNFLSPFKWDYKPFSLHKYGKNKDGLYLGFENELYFPNMDHVKPALAEILSNFDVTQLYSVIDGSIGGIPYGEEGHAKNGFELVSHIFSFTSMVKMDWSKMFSPKQTLHDTCGMHIHLSKAAFTTFHLYKFMKFVYSNRKFITYISERPASKYALDFDGSIKQEAKIMHKPKSNKARRVKVNICNTYTVELRFFAGVINLQSFLKNIEFAHCLFYFTKNNSLKKALSVDVFKKYVELKDSKYPNLYRFILEGEK